MMDLIENVASIRFVQKTPIFQMKMSSRFSKVGNKEMTTTNEKTHINRSLNEHQGNNAWKDAWSQETWMMCVCVCVLGSGG